MSTRSHIDFAVKSKYKNEEGKSKEVEEVRRVYRHSDGYPKGVIPDLKEFLKWNKGRNHDVEYTTANFIYWSKRKREEFYKSLDRNEGKSWEEINGVNAGLKVGFGICNTDDFQIDIKWYYRVVVDRIKDKTYIEIYKTNRAFWDNPKKENLKKVKVEEV